MEDTKLSAEEIEQVISQFEQEKYNKPTLDLVREDLEFGLSKKQIEMYKSKKLRYEHRRAISNAMRQGIPDDVVVRFSGGRYTEQQIAIFTDEFIEGFGADKLFEIMDSTQSGYDMKEACGKVKGKLSNTKEKKEEPEPEKSLEEDIADEKAGEDKKLDASVTGISGQDFMETMKMMMDTFSNTVQMQFDRMDKRDEEFRKSSLDKEAERMLNERITNLESQLADSKKDLSAASGVVNEKEQIIRSLQSDLEDKDKSIQESLSQKDAEIKKLREEMEQMKSGNIPMNGYSGSSGNFFAAGENGPQTVESQAGNTIQGAGAGHTPNYTVNLTTANGKQIPLQVERTERKSQSGLSALMSKFLPKGPAKTLLTRMIEGRYSGEQLTEVMYAYEKHLDEAEVQELLDANLPPEEMHGIINVVAAAKGGEK
ncbi:MAG: hypothetical protein IJ733_12415 [Lachnospiraceae bacterium]|nr:hypothetical protein [Lachnospiraceae bacterium]